MRTEEEEEEEEEEGYMELAVHEDR